MKTFLIALTILYATNVSGGENWDHKMNDLKASPSLWGLWDLVDRSSNCHREYITLIYKENTLLTGTPLMPVSSNNNSDVLKDVIQIVGDNCAGD
ncbi:hypothetical protein N9043_00650 [bacterium]|nr:hypothetical protein [bacterium]